MATQTPIIASTDTLIIRGTQHGRVFTWETEQTARTFNDVQALIDGLVDTSSDVLSVWRVESNDFGHPIIVDDISGDFDLRTSQEIVEQSKRVRERDFSAPAFRQPYTTMNHQQQFGRSA